MPVSLHNPTRAEASSFTHKGRMCGAVEISNRSERIEIFGSPYMCREIAEVIARHTGDMAGERAAAREMNAELREALVHLHSADAIDAIHAEADTLEGGVGTLKFKAAAADYDCITFFAPPAVARAAADAFNEAMRKHVDGKRAAARAREMNAELPEDIREVMQVKGMI